MRFPLIDLAMTGLAELYIFGKYMSFFPNHFSQIKAIPNFDLVLNIAVYGMMLKTFHNVLHLWESSMRIVGLDVETKNKPTQGQKKTN